MSLRSPLGRALGAGSAKEGAGHWWAERVTSVALVPLTLWLFFSLLLLPALDYETVRAWLALPVSSFLALLTLAVMTYHAYLGTAVVVEDYVHGTGAKLCTLLLLRFLHVLFGGAGLFAILRVAFGSQGL
jgi:succinate dehydrogenase / fumarate reductase membrane anchor subunit